MKRITFIFVIIILASVFEIILSTTPSLSQPREHLAATSVGNLALFAGGSNSDITCSDRVDIYNYTSKIWSTATLSQPRTGMVATSVLDLALFAGGSFCQPDYTYDGSNRLDIYNSTSNSWSYMNLTENRNDFVIAAVRDIVLFAGGSTDDSNEDLNRVDIFNVTSQTWTIANLSIARSGFSGAVVKDLVLFAGGSGNSDRVDIYNVTSNTWDITNLTQGGLGFSSATVGNLVLFAGGIGDFSNRVDIFNSTSKTWSTASLSQSRYYLAATSVHDLALFAGGQNYTGYSDRVDIYNLASNTWTTATLSQPRLYLTATSILDDLALFAGGMYFGELGDEDSDRVDIFNATFNVWTPQTCEPGTYVNLNALVGSCSNCLEGTYSTDTNSQNCSICEAGFYSSEGALQCLTCPVGTTSKPGSGSCSKSEESDLTTKLKIAIAVVTAAFGLTLIGIILALIRFSKKRQTGTDFNLELVDTGHWTVIENIEIGERLGGGNFGDVFKGTWNGTTNVALKKLKSSEHLEEFAKEADVLQSLNHPNIVRCLGIHTTATGEQFIVMEYLPKGSVDVLLALEKQSIKLIDLLSMAKDAAAGMLYLEQQKIVHRDLALRNLLAAPDQREKYSVKVSDFGLSRQIKEEGFYMKPENTGIPIRWCAPEVLEKGVYASKSDVWSFGIMLWELFTYGQIPYTGMTNAEVMQRVVAGHRLASPEGCPQELYELMGRCWHHRPEARPGFKEIYDKIESIWNEYCVGNVEITLDNNRDSQLMNANFRSNANYGNRDVQQPSNANYNNEHVNVPQQTNSNYNNQQ